mgnify:CR=1 FL=1
MSLSCLPQLLGSGTEPWCALGRGCKGEGLAESKTGTAAWLCSHCAALLFTEEKERWIQSWARGPRAGRTGKRRLLLQNWPLKSHGLKAVSCQEPAESPPTPSALREEARPWEGKAQPAQGRRVAPVPSGQYTSKWLQLKRSRIPESQGAWSPAKGMAGGQAAVAMAEPARAMCLQP